MSYDLPALCTQVRRDILEMTHAAGSGHPGGSLSAVEILVSLYFDQMKLDPAKPQWADRDRMILSKGHAAPVLYSVLARRGFFDPALLPTLRDAVLGYLPAPGALHDVLSGGGMMSMVSATIMAVSAGLYAGLLGGMGVLNGAAHLAQRLARRAGRFPACAAISVVCSMVFCNQSTCAVVCNQLLEDDYTKRGHGRGEMALDIENSGIVLSPLIPWNISVSIPLAMLGADMSAIPYEILLYAIPLCYWLTKRRVYPPKGDDCYDTIAEPLAHS